MINPNYKITSDVLLSNVDDGAVLLHAKRGVYFGLNPVGSEIWTMLTQGLSSSDCVAQLIASYEIDETTAKQDYEELIMELLEQGLIKLDE